MVRTELVPTTGLEIEERGEKKPVGGTIGKEGEVKKKKRGWQILLLRNNSLVVGDSFSTVVPSVDCVGVKLINSVNNSVVVLCPVK